MPTIEELAKELHDVFNISSGTSRECRVTIAGDKLILEYFNSKISKEEKKVLTMEEADALIQAIYNIYGVKRGEKPNPAEFKKGIV